MSYSDEVLADTPDAYWRLEDMTDSSGNGRTLTNNGSVATAASLLGSDPSTFSREFTGSDTQVLDTADFGGAYDTGSFEAWFSIDTLPAGGSYRTILTKATNGPQIAIGGTEGLIIVKDGVGIVAASTLSIVTATTYHCVWTKSGATNVLYIDGVDRTGSVTNQTMTDNVSNWRVGRGQTTQAWDGLIDEVAIYPTALSQARVQAHYEAGIAAAEAPTLRLVTSGMRW
jgi:hypothetical protein